MAWTQAAREAAAEARRRKAKTRGSSVRYNDQPSGYPDLPKNRGSYAFQVQAGEGRGAPHTVWTRSMKYSEAKNRIMKMAKRVSARVKQTVYVDRLP